MGIWQWSRTAASNDTADPAINLREGMAPSQLNNSARATLAALASYRDDMSGAKETGGANSAYTLSTYGSVVDDSTDYLDNVCVAFVPHATNAANPTLNVDSGGALPLRGQSGVALATGVLIEGTPYVALLGPAKDEWLIHGYRMEPTTIPLGGFLPYAADTAPNSNFVLPYGQAISRSAYSALFTLIGTTYGVGDGTTTFNVPDLRGRVVVGLDDMGSAANRVTSAGSGIDGATTGAVGGAQNVAIAQANLPAYTLPNTLSVTNGGTVVTALNKTVNSVDGGSDTANVLDFTGTTVSTAALSVGGGVTSGGSGTALSNMPPAIVLPYIMRVL